MHSTPFRSIRQRCPRCRIELAEGELSQCMRCEGVWIAEQALHERVAAMQARPSPLIWALDRREQIPCATCAAPMQPLRVFAVPIDRCFTHGLWFDRGELSTVLLESHRHQIPPPARGTDDAMLVADVAVGTASDFGIGAVVEGAVEVIGGLLGGLLD